MTETQKKLQQSKIDKRAEALRNNLRKRKIQQQARKEIIIDFCQIIENPISYSLTNINTEIQSVSQKSLISDLID